MTDFRTIAEEANMIINGYAFTKEKKYIRVLNLNNPKMAIVFNEDGEVLETSMSDIEIRIVKDYLSDNIEFMED